MPNKTASVSSARKHLRNLAFNWGGHASTLLVMFFLSPYIVGKLDAVSYGIWSLLIVLTGYMGLFDLGVRASVGRHVALYLGKEDAKGVDETIRAGLGFFSLAGMGIFAISILIGWAFPYIFEDIPVRHHAMIRLLLPIMVINIWLTAVAAIFSSILSAYERFDVARGVDLVVLVIRTAGTVYALEMNWGLWGLSGSIVFSNVFAVVGCYFGARRYHSALRSWPPVYSKQRLKELLDYGLSAFISSAAVNIIGKTDLVLAGMILTVASVREYNVGYVIPSYLATFVFLIDRTMFPSLQKMVAAEKRDEIRDIFARQIRLALCIGIPAYTGMAMYAQPFIRLWMLQEGFGESSVVLSASIMTVLSVANIPLFFIRPSVSLLAASGHMRITALVSIIEAFANLLLSLLFVLVFKWGLPGIAAGTLAARLLVPSVWIPVYQCKKFAGDIQKTQMMVWGRALVAGLIYAGYCFLLAHFWHPKTWPSLLLHVALGAVVWCLIGFPLLAPKGWIVSATKRYKAYFKKLTGSARYAG